jgi:ubiquitin-conjugating enzyme E2 Z
MEDDADDSLPAFEPHRDLLKQRFLWYYDTYLNTIQEQKSKVKEDQAFMKMPFESSGNGMDGKFRYAELERRLVFIRENLDKETESWAAQGLESKRKESGIAANLQRQFEQTVEAYKRDDAVMLDISLVDGNPFLWELTYFGRPMTNLDGGLFKIRIAMSPHFPDESPRVKFVTPMFHHRISKDGVVCYFVVRQEDIKSHIEAVLDALEEESPPYDPRTLVNPEAAKLYWGSADDKKQYNRRLRRAVQRSVE